jgi:prevent-host-death family protein
MSAQLAPPRLSITQVRQKLAEAIQDANNQPIEIVKGTIAAGKPVAVLVSADQFASMQARAANAENALRSIMIDTPRGSEKEQLAVYRLRVQTALAQLRPRKKYKLNELLALAGDSIPIDRDFLNTPAVGKELV